MSANNQANRVSVQARLEFEFSMAEWGSFVLGVSGDRRNRSTLICIEYCYIGTGGAALAAQKLARSGS